MIGIHDVVVVGGGVAGLSTALVLGRARRRVLVLDGGAPRNTPAEHAHGLLSRDGIPPLELLQLARGELASYPSVEVRAGEATDAAATSGGFHLTSAESEPIDTRKLVLATGVTDVLPEIPGVQDLWGRGVYHCPYCHGWEVRDRVWGILGDSPLAVERVALFRGWASGIVVLSNGASSIALAEKESLRRLGASLDERPVALLERTGEDDVKVNFRDRSNLTLGGIFIMPHQEQRSFLAATLGCEMHEFPPTDSQYVTVDAATGATSIAGVYAAGDMVGPMQSLVLAAASGARAAYALNQALATEDAQVLLTASSGVAQRQATSQSR
jgi:thioredoxin reductase